MWLEMSRNEEHGGPGWGFTECLWAPSHKTSLVKWGFWETLLKVKKGDLVVHLRGRTHSAAFVGYSIADSDGFETNQRPPIPSDWAYAKTYYRVPLVDFTPFSEEIKLDDVFIRCKDELTRYFMENRQRQDGSHERLFFVIQSNRLQCLNGAYLSNFSSELAKIMLGFNLTNPIYQLPNASGSSKIGEQLSQVYLRIGQSEFSANVRNNYGNQCCFPSCKVKDSMFLVGAHIARWADESSMRGLTENGLCFCLFHDKAFEQGLFTLDRNFKVKVNYSIADFNDWAKENLLPFENQNILKGIISPSIKAIEAHWKRIGFAP